jgi:hypothetical protein
MSRVRLSAADIADQRRRVALITGQQRHLPVTATKVGGVGPSA